MLGKLFNLTAGAAADGSQSTHGLGSSPPSKHFSSLESVQEDIHTRNLLFPDAESLYQHRNDQVFPLSSAPSLPSTSAANSFDYDGDIDIEPRDVRILIMQDALSGMPAALIYDSQAPPPVTTPPLDRPSTMAGFAAPGWQDPRQRQPVSPRKPSVGQASRPVVIQQDSQPQPRQGAFDRRASMQGRAQPRVESESQRAHREYAEELKVFSSCIFGNSELMAYKGTSTKVHVVPSDPRNDPGVSAIGDGRGSLGRASVRSSKLSQSFSSEAIGEFMPPMSTATPHRFPHRKKVLITRLFPVTLPSVDDTSNLAAITPQSRFSEDSTGFPFPQHGDDAKAKKKQPQPKQKRTPMYAVALIINLPQGPSSSVQNNPISASRQSFRGSGSYNEHESFSSSFGSARRAGWSMAGQGPGADSLEPSYMGDIEDRIDPITQHWDVIMRTLTHLQSVVATKLFGMLRQVDIASPDPMPSSITSQVARNPSMSRRRSDDGAATMKPSKTNAKALTLLPYCLMENEDIKQEAELAKARIVCGLLATRVVTGQNRWGIWREEARWAAKWAGGKEQGFFFYSLLTGYLATHTDWLQALGPSYYRKRHMHQLRARGDEDMALPARTVVVAGDKMAARRLIFLLAAFLPANQQVATSVRPHRPSTSASFGGAFSHSPPSYVVPILKEESLRRKINRRTVPRRTSHSRTTSLQGQVSRGSSSGVPAHMAHLSIDRGHERRSSDAISIRTTHLPISASDSHTRKSSAATAATITPEATIPHFSTLQRQESLPSRRPVSASSVAADDLKRTLQRGDSGLGLSNNGNANGAGGNESRPISSTWGVLAGLWNARRRGSRGSTDLTAHKRESIGSLMSSPMSPTKPTFRNQQEQSRTSFRGTVDARATKAHLAGDAQSSASGANLGQQDVSGVSNVESNTSSAGDGGPRSPRVPRLARLSDDRPELTPPPRPSASFQRIPDPSGAFESPVKTSINADDGVIDVDVPFPDYITSFETAISSPSSSGYLSTPGGSGLELFEHSSRLAADGDLPFNVAGWLEHYHPDFILQAVPPQRGLTEQVKASLRAEPSPQGPLASSHSMSVEPQQERWLDVSSVIIADATNFTIKRIRYRRLVRPKPAPEFGGAASLLSASSVNTHSSAVALLTPAIAPYETKLEEEFLEEPIITLDDVLVEAVERVVGHGGGELAVPGRQGASASSSRSTSKRRGRSNSASTEPGEGGHHTAASAPGATAAAAALQEVPRSECKTVILSALEEVVREVVERREKESEEAQEDHDQREMESDLRLAVRGWLESVEMGE